MNITMNFIVHSKINFSYYYYQNIFNCTKFTTFYFKESVQSILIYYYFAFGFPHGNKND